MLKKKTGSAANDRFMIEEQKHILQSENHYYNIILIGTAPAPECQARL